MKRLFIFLLIVLFAAAIGSCHKSSTTDATATAAQFPPVTYDSIFKCYTATAWDANSIKNTLTGNWNWEFIKCYWNPEKANGQDYKNISLQFNTDGTLQVKQSGQVIQSTTWTITAMADGYFKITTGALVPYIVGRVLVCKNRVIFYDSYTDGCDNYFVKQ